MTRTPSRSSACCSEVDAVLIETSQDLLQAKAAVLASHVAMGEIGRRVPILVSVTVETTGTMLLGSEIGAALTALEPWGSMRSG